MNGLEYQIVDELEEGEENAKSAREIAEAVGLQRGQAQTIIRELVDEGLPIAAGHSGHYIPRDDNEINSYLDRLQDRVENLRDKQISVLEAWENW